MKKSLENMSTCFLYNFTILPIRSTCPMWPNYPVTEQVGMAFKLRQRNYEKFTVMWSHSPLNLEFGHFTYCLAEHSEEKYHLFLKFNVREDGQCRAKFFVQGNSKYIVDDNMAKAGLQTAELKNCHLHGPWHVPYLTLQRI